MQCHPFDQGLLLGILLDPEPPLYRGYQEGFAPIHLISGNGRPQGSEVYPDLVHPPCYRPAFDQAVIGKYLQRGKSCLGILAFGGNPGGAIVLFKDRCVHQLILKIVPSIGNGVVDLGDLPVLKLHAQVPVGLRIPCDGQHA